MTHPALKPSHPPEEGRACIGPMRKHCYNAWTRPAKKSLATEFQQNCWSNLRLSRISWISGGGKNCEIGDNREHAPK